MRNLLVLLPLVLAACQASDPPPEPQASPSPAAQPSTAAPAATSVPANRIGSTEQLAGEYRIAGVDGQGIDQPYAITATISRDRIHVTADCINSAWSYRFAGAALVTERVAVEGCARGLTKAEEAIVKAFDAAQSVSRNSAGGLEFTGGGRSVTLFSQ